MNYYSIPLRFDKLLKGSREYEIVELRESIHQNIRLIVKSFTLRYRFDPTFGCVMNKYHAATPPQNMSKRVWREKIRDDIQKNLLDMLRRYETRVLVHDLNIELVTKSKSGSSPMALVKVELNGELKIGNRDKFHYPDSEISEEAQEVFPLMIPVGKSK